MLVRWIPAFVIAVALGCDGSAAPVDAGARDAGRDAHAEQCAREADCGDPTAYCARWRCEPGSAAADDRGCVDLGSPCEVGHTCDEPGRRCVGATWCTDGREGCAAPGDCDGDGHDALECGGDDCDDDDAARYPGNTEVCDSEGVDEDCDPTTVGARDMDGDGYTSAACCNGETCGTDCDDSNASVRPGVGELCNGIDDDCDGAEDETGAFCPVGVCISRRCRAANWERVYDGPSTFDAVFAVAVDDLGNSYFLVRVPDGADLDDDTVAEAGGTYVVSLQPDGRVRWFAAVATTNRSLALAPDGSVIVPTGRTLSRMDPGSGAARTAYTLADFTEDPDFVVVRTGSSRIVAACSQGGRAHLVVLGSDGAEVARLSTPESAAPSAVHDLAVSDYGIALTAESSGAFELDARAIPMGRFVVALDHDLAARWAHGLPSGVSVNPHGVAISRSGDVAVGGTNATAFTPPWGGAAWPAPMGFGDGFAVVFAADGSHVFSHRHIGPGADNFGSVEFDDRGGLLVAGVFTGTLPVTPRGVLTSTGSASGFYALWDAASTFTSDARAFSGSGFAIVQDVAIDPYGGMLVTGRFNGQQTLVLGTEYERAGAGFAARVADIDP